jgi:phosphomannomutase
MAGSVPIEELMRRTGVEFGTSGARGLVTAMTDEVCSSYAAGFLRWLALDRPTDIALAGDRRPSTARILEAVAAGVARAGHRPVNCGLIPTPALALHAMGRGIPSMMVTGSHIPEDRNGIKFNTPAGEILKGDEAAIRATVVEPRAERLPLPPVDETARHEYRARFVAAWGPDALAGRRVGVYGHSAVGRDDLLEIVRALGAEVTALHFTDAFEAVDTEAIRREDVERARAWAGDFDAIVSTDGDSDRPLVADEHGTWLRGDVTGIIVARAFAADVVVTPVSSNTAVERCGAFATVVRTKIGSPYVIEAMQARSERTVVGYEANGGFLTATPVAAPCGRLSALPTRDAIVVIVSLLHLAAAERRPLSALVADLPRRFTFSGRVEDLPRERSVPRIEAMDLAELGDVVALDRTDGLRVTFGDDTIIHLRPSGNAPELRCYTEADDPDRARALAESMLRRVEAWK